MKMIRTTLRLEEALKKAAHQMAIEQNTSLQELFNNALRNYLKNQAEKKAKKLVFPSIDLGVPLDNLTRDDFYDNRF